MIEFFHFLKENSSFTIIANAYKGKTAKRSGVPYLNHIIEGAMVIYDYCNYSVNSPIIDFCLHPIFQNDDKFKKINFDKKPFKDLSKTLILNCVEYRNVANSYMVNDKIKLPESINLSPIKNVNIMLIGDKVQNKKDFMKYMYKKKSRSSYQKVSDNFLDYFNSWLLALGINEERFQYYYELLNKHEEEVTQFVINYQPFK